MLHIETLILKIFNFILIKKHENLLIFFKAFYMISIKVINKKIIKGKY